MLQKLRCGLVLLVCLLFLSDAARCAAVEGGSRRLVSPQLLEHANLEIVWDNELPIKKGESLERLVLLDNRIYAFSDRNYIVSLNREEGIFVFSRPVAPVGYAVLGLELYQNRVLSIIGERLVEIDPETGKELGSEYLGIGVTCPAVRNSSYFYLGGTDRRLRALRAADKVKVFEVAAENDSMISSIVADERFVVFATDAGNVISIRPDAPWRLWQFEAEGGVVGPIVRDRESLFFASEDTNVYKLNVLTGEFVWRYEAAAVLDTAPRVTREVVYQYVSDSGLTAIDKRSGKFKWKLEEGVDLLAESDGKAYVITKIGTLVVMDNERAKRLYTVNFAGVSRYVTNVADSKIYIADDAGRIACLRPIK